MLALAGRTGPRTYNYFDQRMVVNPDSVGNEWVYAQNTVTENKYLLMPDVGEGPGTRRGNKVLAHKLELNMSFAVSMKQSPATFEYALIACSTANFNILDPSEIMQESSVCKEFRQPVASNYKILRHEMLMTDPSERLNTPYYNTIGSGSVDGVLKDNTLVKRCYVELKDPYVVTFKPADPEQDFDDYDVPGVNFLLLVRSTTNENPTTATYDFDAYCRVHYSE